jgi:hypothetical protein
MFRSLLADVYLAGAQGERDADRVGDLLFILRIKWLLESWPAGVTRFDWVDKSPIFAYSIFRRTWFWHLTGQHFLVTRWRWVVQDEDMIFLF